jgi:hypothetical protein
MDVEPALERRFLGVVEVDSGTLLVGIAMEQVEEEAATISHTELRPACLADTTSCAAHLSSP